MPEVPAPKPEVSEKPKAENTKSPDAKPVERRKAYDPSKEARSVEEDTDALAAIKIAIDETGGNENDEGEDEGDDEAEDEGDGDEAPAEKPDDGRSHFHDKRDTLLKFGTVSDAKISELKDSIGIVLGLSPGERENMKLTSLRPQISGRNVILGVAVFIPRRPDRYMRLKFSTTTGKCLGVEITKKEDTLKEKTGVDKPTETKSYFDGTRDTLRNFNKVSDAKIGELKDIVKTVLKLSAADRRAMTLSLGKVRTASRTEDIFQLVVTVRGRDVAGISLEYDKKTGTCVKVKIK
jgi:hypothetical protein